MADKPRDPNLPQHSYNEGHYGTLPFLAFPSGSTIGAVGILVDNGASVVTTGVKADIPLFFNCNVTGVEILANLSGGLILDIQRGTYGQFPTTSSIAASSKPTMNSAIKYLDQTLTGWTLNLSGGDVLRFIVNSSSTITRFTFALRLERTT